MRLHEIQTHFCDAVVRGETSGIAPALIGGLYPEKRLAIHQRNYHASLVDALITKFPATEWLLGTWFLTEVAERFIQEYPPAVPCIAEYGSEFPDFLRECASKLAYVRDFAHLEWCIGKAAIAVDRYCIGSGTHYLHVGWPVDELIKLYLSDNAPAQFELEPLDVWIQVCGARGEFQLKRVSEPV